jgi:hypothetical protein
MDGDFAPAVNPASSLNHLDAESDQLLSVCHLLLCERIIEMLQTLLEVVFCVFKHDISPLLFWRYCQMATQGFEPRLLR